MSVHLDRARETHPTAEFPKPPTSPRLPPAPWRPRHFPCNSRRLGPTLTEEEEADEEQVELGRFHSSARRGRAGGQLGLAVSFSSSALPAQPEPRSSPGRPPAVRRSPGPRGLASPVSAASRHKWPVSSRLGKPGSSAASPLGADPSPLPASRAHSFLPAPPTASERASEGPVTEGLLSLELGRGEGGS